MVGRRVSGVGARKERGGAGKKQERPGKSRRGLLTGSPSSSVLQPGSADWRSLTLAGEGGPGGGDSAGRAAAVYCWAAGRRRRTRAPPPLPLSGCHGDNGTPRGGGGGGDNLRAARPRPPARAPRRVPVAKRARAGWEWGGPGGRGSRVDDLPEAAVRPRGRAVFRREGTGWSRKGSVRPLRSSGR
ncbi:hypothetical protein NN561_014695 [Cricetulus griseus]